MTTVSSVSIIEGSKEDLHAKLVAYQQFMSSYIVKAQEEKLAAVQAAEAAVTKKYEEKIQRLLPGGSTDAPPLSVEASKDNMLYMERNARVSEAAKAGKSRWGDMETKRATEQVQGGASNVVVDVPPAVQEADHGLRADGGVGGPSLAERVALGANGASAPAAPVTPRATPVVSRNQKLYHERNEMVNAAAKAGKSRWGPMEVEKATQFAGLPVQAAAAPAAAIPVSPQVEAADHGLRSDGGVGGPSLAERVNMGAQVEEWSSNGGTTPRSSDLATSGSDASLYQRRNAYVSAAAHAGKSRWGNMEVEKASLLSKNVLPAATATADVAAADHGLRADGGAEGPSLADRVNLGAQLLGTP